MSRPLRKIKLSQIILETSFRNKEKDLSLELSINKNGLLMPLVVEEKREGLYVLVDGYRRFYALEFSGITEAECLVEAVSSEEERIIKRLGLELHTKKRTAYQLEKMIKRLLESIEYDIKRIANLCNVTERTILRYIRGADVNPDWLRRGEQTGVGRHAFTDIHKLNLNEEAKNHIANKYINRQINRSTVQVIKKVSGETSFNDIPEEAIAELIDQIIEQQQTKSYEGVKELVWEKKLQAGYSKSSHTFIHNLNLNLLARISKSFNNSHYVNYLSARQKAQLTKSLQNLLQIINPPIKWTDFPKNNQVHERMLNKNKKGIKHY